MNSVVFAYWNVENDEPVEVRLWQAQRVFEGLHEVAELAERYVLRGILVESLPDFVVHIEVVLSEALLDVFGCLAEVLENDRYVHVDDDEETDDEIRYKKDDRLARAPAVAVQLNVGRRPVAVLLVHQPGEHRIPPGRRRHLEQQDHAAEERLEVEHVVDSLGVFDVHEKRHSKD